MRASQPVDYRSSFSNSCKSLNNRTAPCTSYLCVAGYMMTNCTSVCAAYHCKGLLSVTYLVTLICWLVTVLTCVTIAGSSCHRGEESVPCTHEPRNQDASQWHDCCRAASCRWPSQLIVSALTACAHACIAIPIPDMWVLQWHCIVDLPAHIVVHERVGLMLYILCYYCWSTGSI